MKNYVVSCLTSYMDWSDNVKNKLKSFFKDNNENDLNIIFKEGD